MRRNLRSLIRLYAWQLDEERRKLAELLRTVEDLERQGRALEAEIVSEQRAAANAPEEAGMAYGAYAEAAIERRRRIAESSATVETEIGAARERLRGTLRRLRSVEVAQEHADRQMALEADRKAQNTLDDLALQRHRRGS